MNILEEHVDNLRQFVSEILASGQFAIPEISMIVGLDPSVIQEIHDEMFVTSSEDSSIYNEIIDDFIDR